MIDNIRLLLQATLTVCVSIIAHATYSSYLSITSFPNRLVNSITGAAENFKARLPENFDSITGAAENLKTRLPENFNSIAEVGSAASSSLTDKISALESQTRALNSVRDANPTPFNLTIQSSSTSDLFYPSLVLAGVFLIAVIYVHYIGLIRTKRVENELLKQALREKEKRKRGRDNMNIIVAAYSGVREEWARNKVAAPDNHIVAAESTLGKLQLSHKKFKSSYGKLQSCTKANLAVTNKKLSGVKTRCTDSQGIFRRSQLKAQLYPMTNLSKTRTDACRKLVELIKTRSDIKIFHETLASSPQDTRSNAKSQALGLEINRLKEKVPKSLYNHYVLSVNDLALYQDAEAEVRGNQHKRSPMDRENQKNVLNRYPQLFNRYLPKLKGLRIVKLPIFWR